MEFINWFFIVLSIVVLVYMIRLLITDKRTNRLVELLFLGVYGLVMILFLFPGVLRWIESTLGIASAINFFVYLSIFVLFLLVLYLYRKLEDQRSEITKLTREIAVSNVKKKK